MASGLNDSDILERKAGRQADRQGGGYYSLKVAKRNGEVGLGRNESH